MENINDVMIKHLSKINAHLVSVGFEPISSITVPKNVVNKLKDELRERTKYIDYEIKENVSLVLQTGEIKILEEKNI